MALSFIDNVDYRGKKPNFTRDLFDTIANMAAYSENYLPDVFVACCKETGKLYMFNRENESDATLGKWREYVSSNSSGTVAGDITFTTDVGNIPAGTTFPAGTPVEVILTNLSGTTYTEESVIYYGVVDSVDTDITLDILTKVETAGAVSVEVTCDNQYIVFVSENEIVEIRDGLGLPNDTEFTKSQKTIDDVNYYVYIGNYPITCTEFVYTITN